MTNIDDYDEEVQEENEKKKKKKGETETTVARKEIDVSPAAYQDMLGRGFSKGQIADVLRNWRHLCGEGLMRVLADFAKRVTRSSAHVEVEIGPEKQYGLVFNFLNFIKNRGHAPTHKPSIDSQPKLGPR